MDPLFFLLDMMTRVNEKCISRDDYCWSREAWTDTRGHGHKQLTCERRELRSSALQATALPLAAQSGKP